MAYIFLRKILKKIFPYKYECQQTIDEPCIFVANHMEISGPIITELYIPYNIRPWIIDKMLDKKTIKHHMISGISRIFPKRAEFRNKITANILSPFIYNLLSSTNPIPVHRTGRGILETINKSVSALDNGESILLFPENPTDDGHYKLEGASKFYTGFVSIAKKYYEKTGKSIKFNPVYADRKNKILTVGNHIEFNPKSLYSNEKERIASYLYSFMIDSM